MKYFATLVLFTLLLHVQSIGRDCISVNNGEWNASLTWLCNGAPDIPASGDNIQISVGDTVTIYNGVYSIEGSPVNLYIYGKLDFDLGGKLDLPLGSGIEVFPGNGSITSSSNGQSNRINIGNSTVWTSQDGPVFSGTLGNPPPPISPLPVQLSGFEGTASSKGISLTWNTLSELNNKAFQILFSISGTDFQPLNQISGAGTHNSPVEYQYFHDIRLSSGQAIYYRLDQQDFDGRVTTLGQLALNTNIEVNSDMTLYPNPSTSTSVITIQFNESMSPGRMEVYSIDGRLVHAYVISANSNKITFDLSEVYFTPGVYLVHVRNNKSAQKSFLVINP